MRNYCIAEKMWLQCPEDCTLSSSIMWFGQENEHIFLNKVEWWLNRPRGMHTFFLNTTGGQENEHIFFTSPDLCGYKKMNTFSFDYWERKTETECIVWKSKFLVWSYSKDCCYECVLDKSANNIQRSWMRDLCVVILTM